MASQTLETLVHRCMLPSLLPFSLAALGLQLEKAIDLSTVRHTWQLTVGPDGRHVCLFVVRFGVSLVTDRNNGRQWCVLSEANVEYSTQLRAIRSRSSLSRQPLRCPSPSMFRAVSRVSSPAKSSNTCVIFVVCRVCLSPLCHRHGSAAPTAF